MKESCIPSVPGVAGIARNTTGYGNGTNGNVGKPDPTRICEPAVVLIELIPELTVLPLAWNVTATSVGADTKFHTSVAPKLNANVEVVAVFVHVIDSGAPWTVM